MAKFEFVNAFWKGNQVALLRRDGEKLAVRYVPAEYCAFFKSSEMSEGAERTLRASRHVCAMTRVGDWWRVRFANFKILRAACLPLGTKPSSDAPVSVLGMFERLGIVPHEADVNPVRRFMTENDVELIKPRRCYLDLEVDSRVPIVDQIAGKSRILSWALVDDETGERVFGCLDQDNDDCEVELIKDLWCELQAFDQICGWGLDGYDQPVLLNRSERLGLRLEPRRWLWLDHMEVYRRYNMSASESGEEKESVALGRVANAVLGRGKLDVEMGGGKNFALWQTNPQRLVEYNIEDVVLEREIEQATGYLELHWTSCRVCNTLPDSRGTNPTNFVEGYMLKLGRDHNHYFPTKFRQQYEKYEGAFVMEPKRIGLIKGVHVCDFAALYPSVIISWNISPETLTNVTLKESRAALPSYLRHMPIVEKPLPPDHCVVPFTEKVFRTDIQGMLPIALIRLLEQRNHWKKLKASLPPGTPAWKDADRMSSGYKIVANSFYGVMGSVFSRFFKREIAESISQGAKWLLLELDKAAVARGFEPIAGDTDSLFVAGVTRDQFRLFVDWANAELFPKILADKGCKVNRVKLSYEKEFSRIIMIKKKRYAGKYAHYEGTDATAESKPEIKGLEYKRGDTTKLARDMQYELIMALLRDEVEEVEVLREFVRKWRDRVLNDKLTLAEIRMSQKLSRDVRAYASKLKKDGSKSALPVHVNVARVLGERGEDVREGVRIEYVVVDGRTPLKAIPVADYTGEGEDRFYLWENLVYPPTQRVLEAAFPQHKWKNYLRARPKGMEKTAIDPFTEGEQGTLFA